ncbi:hypothetical protein CEQ90_08565 [Lewinellaceae bacterium SD302]|nr:hypothetical protein CEQ90_08565 [Lewinellaceae bacterium SD302]
MLDSKVVRQILKMDGRERERLRQFVDSPYFNQHQRTVKFLALVLGELDSKRPALSKERVFKKIFPDETFREQPLADLMSGLMKLVSRFLAVEQLTEDPYAEDIFALERAQDKARFDLLKSREKKLSKKLKKAPRQSKDYYWANYRLHAVYGYYRNKYEVRNDAQPLQNMLHALDRFYIVEKLRHACHLTANSMLMNTTFEFGFLDDILAYITSPAGNELLEKDVSISCYYHILMSLREPEEKLHYEKIRHYFGKELDSFPEQEQENIFGFATNYCIARINAGDGSYLRELFELYRRAISTGVLYEHGIISEWNYKNIVTIGCGVKEYDWTESFMESHYSRLPEKRRENAYAMNKAQYYYSRGLYDEAGNYLREVEDADVKYHLARVLLEVRIAYDRQETNFLLSQLESLRLYVRRNQKMSVKEKRNYQNYIRFTKQLATLKHQQEFMGREQFRQKLESLHGKIMGTEQLVARGWLVEESGS